MNRKEIRTKKKELNVLGDVITIINQYFPELINKFDGLTDLRHQSYVEYKMKVIFMVRLLALMCEIKSMHELTREFNTNEAIENIAQICGLKLEEIPHCDTINDVFKNIKVEEIEQIRKYMITRLIRNKMLDRYKIRGQYYHIIVDGTGLATSRKKYNENCLVKNKTDKNGKLFTMFLAFTELRDLGDTSNGVVGVLESYNIHNGFIKKVLGKIDDSKQEGYIDGEIFNEFVNDYKDLISAYDALCTDPTNYTSPIDETLLHSDLEDDNRIPLFNGEVDRF